MSRVLRDVCQISSGTMAGLIADPRYVVIDRVRCEWIEFVMDHEEQAAEPQFGTWQEAWLAFRQVNPQPALESQGEAA